MVARPVSLQELFFRKLIAEKIPVTMFLVNRLKLQGAITQIDSFSMVIVRGSTQLLVYKHAVATVVPDAPIKLNAEARGEA